MNNALLNLLKEEFRKINLCLKNNNWPYLFIVSDNREIRDFLENNLKKSELLDPLSNENVLYCGLSHLKEKTQKTNHCLVIVCNKEFVNKFLSINSSLTSCSKFIFVDDIIKEKEEHIDNVMKEFSSGIIDVDSNPEALDEAYDKTLILRRKLVENSSKLPHNYFY